MRDLDLMVEVLNDLGEEGWELVGFVGIKKGITQDRAACILKRERA